MSTVNDMEDEIVARLAASHLLDETENQATLEEMEKERIAMGEKTEKHHSGGLVFLNRKALEFQRQVMWDFVKTLGWNIASGKSVNLLNVSLPVKLFEPKTMLQRVVDGWHYAPYMLSKAAASDDPLFRFKCVLAFVIGGLKSSMTQWKPFNPILGETYQAEYKDGTQVFLEQTSHHPPVSHYQLIPPNQGYHFFGYAQYTANVSGNTLKGNRYGPNVASFPDGQKIIFDSPEMWLSGVLWGDRVADFQGGFHIKDKKNDLKCEIMFNPDALNMFMSLFYKQATPSDFFRGEIKKGDKKICSVSGSWLSHISFDDEKFFEFSSELSERPQPVADPLPSDCRSRDDLISLAAGKYDDAQENKKKLEEIQRNDRKLRAKYSEGKLSDKNESSS